MRSGMGVGIAMWLMMGLDEVPVDEETSHGHESIIQARPEPWPLAYPLQLVRSTIQGRDRRPTPAISVFHPWVGHGIITLNY